MGVAVGVASLAVAVATVWAQQDDPETATSRAGPASDDGGDPLTVAVQTIEDHRDATWFVPRPVAEIAFGPVDPAAVDWPDFPAADGGAPLSPFALYFTVQGRSEADVVLTGAEVHLVERREAPTGVVLRDPCGGAGAFRWLGIDLDADPPEIVSLFEPSAVDPADDSVSLEELQPVRFPYHVSASEAEVFTVRAYTLDCDCTWYLELSWQSQGRSGTAVVDDGGRPFRTVGVRNAAASCSADGTCQTPLPPHYLELAAPPPAGDGKVAVPLGDP